MRPLTLLLLAVGLWNCTDPIDLTTDFETPQLVVDAWLTDESRPQTITLTLTQDYYDNRLPTPVEDATVTVCQTNLGNECFSFVHQDSGRYVWTPDQGEKLGEVGEAFALAINRGEDIYGSQTTLYRVPPIDSISVQLEEEQLGLDEGLYAQLYARDFTGLGDAYLIRTTINDTFLNRPDELNLVFDATFDAGSATDGIAFIFPIRFSINKRDDDGAFVPLLPGDRVSVDIWSLSPQAFTYLSIARDQIQNGDNGIFQVPVANAPGNIIGFETAEDPLGVFNVAAVSTASKVVE